MDMRLSSRPCDLAKARATREKTQFQAPWAWQEELVGRASRISARTGEWLDAFRAELADRLRENMVTMHLRIPMDHGAELAALKNTGVVFEEDYDEGNCVVLRAHVPKQHAARYEAFSLDAPE